MNIGLLHFFIILIAVISINLYVIHRLYFKDIIELKHKKAVMDIKDSDDIQSVVIPDTIDNINKIDPNVADDLHDGELPPLNKDYRKLGDILKGASRRYQLYPNGVIPGGVFNIPTQGFYESFQVMGYLSSTKKSGLMLKLFGRRIDKERYEYYTVHNDDPLLKIPIDYKNNKELYDGDIIQVPGFTDDFVVKLYDFESPKYIPFVYS